LTDIPIVLVVESNDAIQGLVQDALSKGGFETAIAGTGEEAVTLTRSLLGGREKGEGKRRKVLSTRADIIGYLHLARKTNSFLNIRLAAVPF
jgi:CheY-like chemotaxis protein